LCLIRGLRAMKAVFQFDHRNRREHNLVLTVMLLEGRQQADDWLRFSFGDDQSAGIQD
jgi:hypothetical protein